MKDGGPAFPQVGEVPMDGWKRDAKVVRFEGMSLRDWYAGMAMQGFCCHPFLTDPTKIAEYALQVADAMLTTRET